jgi:hypothetical protein
MIESWLIDKTFFGRKPFDRKTFGRNTIDLGLPTTDIKVSVDKMSVGKTFFDQNAWNPFHA